MKRYCYYCSSRFISLFESTMNAEHAIGARVAIVSTSQPMKNASTQMNVASKRASLAMGSFLEALDAKHASERARIHRKTFYLHFETIEALYDDRLQKEMYECFDYHETTPDVSEAAELLAVMTCNGENALMR